MHTKPFLLLVMPAGLLAQSTVSTVAGSGAIGFSGDGGPATAASFNRSVNVHLDALGNLYVADENNHRIRRIDPRGVITTFAGNGAAGFSGDNGPAAAASLNGPTGVCSDAQGNVYVNDNLNRRIRRVDRSGVITTFAGNGGQGWSGEGGPAAAATLTLPIRCAVDAQGTLFFVDQGAHRVARIDGGVLNRIARTGARGFSGDGGPAASAVLDNPTALAVDYAGNVFFSDQFNHRIRRIAPGGTITTIAGTGAQGFSGDNGPATAAQVNFPGAMATDQSGNLYFTDGPNQRTRRISRAGVIATIAGNGIAGFSGDGGPATAASFNGAFGITLDASGNLYVADTLNNRIRRISGIGPGSAPTFSTEGTVNAASFRPGLAPGSLATIFGRELSPANGIVVVSQAPWPTTLNGVSVTVNGVAAPLYGIAAVNGQEQISFQVPFEAAGASASLVVRNNGSQSAAVNVALSGTNPGIFLIDGTNGAFLKPDFSVIGPANPVDRNTFALMYLTGLGAVSPGVASGGVAPGAEPFARTVATPVVTVAGQNAEVVFSGLAPGFIGLYQVNFRIPAGIDAGSQEVVVTVGGVRSNGARIQVR